MSADVGTIHVQCPECCDTIPIAVKATLTPPSDDGQFVNCEPDMTDVWAHAWTHQPD